VRVRRGLPSLRARRALAVLRGAFAAGAERFGFRLCQFSVQHDHLHLIVEAEDREALSRGVKASASGSRAG
jgi:REP element-mobilizing transposase RayT